MKLIETSQHLNSNETKGSISARQIQTVSKELMRRSAYKRIWGSHGDFSTIQVILLLNLSLFFL